ncbi:hypothetical protein AWC38_SpisGene15613 [Stylophora pistillata]|uniref:Fibronectin type-III domain-containing protein n=1 Tax=Stylophora pistillata TaxID=50429 RepID=A0A2B4RT33_STYPI|nr:hypothetical protein AWC38_SpisGene15613 [Stylophora pistillata]
MTFAFSLSIQKCHISRKKSWTNDDSLPCNDGVPCTRNDHCSNGRCIGTPFSCLSCEECYNDACRIKPGHCIIIVAGVRTCFAHGERRPGYPCQQCDSNNINKWTINNNLQCSDRNMRTKDDHCVTGICVGTFYNCPSCEAHDGSGCPIKPGYCVIQHRGQKTCFARNQYKPGNPCQWCNPGGTNSAWSNRDGMACDDGNKCTRADKCISGQCSGISFTCNSLCQFCNGTSCSLKTGFGFVNKTCTCKVAGQDYSQHAINPSNQCQWCDLYDTAARANSAWSNRPAVPCDDGNKCTKQDTCNAGRCSGLGYSCQWSHLAPSCIKASVCVGDGTCRPSLKSNRTICRPALDACDQPERCDGILGGCPGMVTDDIFINIGDVQIVDSKQQSPIQYQYITDRLFLKISGFSSTCGSISLRWSLLLGSTPCSFNANISGTLEGNNDYHTVRGLSLQDMASYKISVRASDLRGKTYLPVCSKAVVIDTSKPHGGWIHDGPRADLSYQASTLLQVNWGGVQARHGVSLYKWKVILNSFVSNKTVELMPFNAVNLNTNAQRSFDNIEDGSKVRFIVRVYTKAGLFSDLTSDGVIIDTSAPLVGKVNDGNQIGRDLKCANWTSTFTANWEQFTDPHSPIARYTFAVQREGTGLITSFQTTSQGFSSTIANVNLISKQSYCAVVRGYNKAGLYSTVNSDCLLIDHDAPQAGSVNDGHFSDIDYQSDNTMIAVNWHGFTDGYKGSGISEYKYKVQDSSGSTIISWTSAGNSTNITHNGLTLSNNIKYFVTVRAIDAVGLSTDVTSDGFNVDTTRPVFTGKIIVTGKDDFVNGTSCVYIPSTSSVRVTWLGFSDAHSGLKSYLWAIIPSDSTPTDSAFKVVHGGNLPTSASFSGLALTQGKSYVFIIRAYNGANRYKDAHSVLIIPDSTSPSPGYLFDGPNPQTDVDYQADLRHVYASWTKFLEPHTEVKQYYLAVGSCMMGNYHVTGNRFIKVTPPTTTSFVLANISLTNGQKYCVKIKAENKAGLVSLEVSSDGFIVDATLPSVRKAQVRDGSTGSDLDFQESNTTLSAQWDGFSDPESGIEHYEYGVSRNRAGLPNIVPFQNVGMNTSAALTGLTLTDGVFYVIVCALNKAGLRNCISSDGVLLDLSLPSHGVVHDGIMVPDKNYQSTLTNIAANWEGIWDLDSGIEKFEWSIGTSKHNKTSVLNYTDVGLSTHVRSHGNLNLTSGKKYYVHLRVTNQAGGVRELSSDGVVADGTPPIPSTIYPGSGSQSKWKYNAREQVFFSDDTSALHVYWDRFSEPESEIWYYKWAIGTSKCGTQVQPLINIGQSNYVNTTNTDLVFRSGVKYFVTVMARNRAGLVSQSCSDAFIFDRTPPLAGKVNIEEASSKTANKIFLSNSNVSISWERFTDEESGISACKVSVLDAAGKTLFTASFNASLSNLTIPSNVTRHPGEYTANVKCINNAGLFSLSSALFLIDNTPPFPKGPIVAGVSRDGFFQYQSDNDSITASWPPFTDDESDVKSYYCAIGSEPYKDNIIPFENVGLATELTRTNLRLSHGETYFITVISQNQAGLSSNITSLGLKIDTSQPLAESKDVQDGKHDEDIDFFSSAIELSGQWKNITDPESGISESEYWVGTTPHGCQIKAMTSTGKSKSFVCPECVANEGERVFVTVYVTNGAGLSKTVSSDGMLLDGTPPSIGSVIDGSQATGVDSFAVLENWNVSVTCFGVEDPESGVQSCTWTIEDMNAVIWFEKNITNHSISEEKSVFIESKTYKDLGFDKSITYFNVLTCWNKAIMQATVRSDGFRVESVWPVPGRVRDGLVIGTDLDFLNNTKVISANWDPFVSDTKDPVITYEIAIGISPGKEDILSYLNIGLKRNIEKDLAPGIRDIDVLKSGAKYYVTIRATTLSGLSSVEQSDGFIADPSPPLKAEVSVSHTVVDQETQTIEISVSWSGVKDLESGIHSSAYCLQTNPRTCGSGPVPAGASLQVSPGIPFSGDEFSHDISQLVPVILEHGTKKAFFNGIISPGTRAL